MPFTVLTANGSVKTNVPFETTITDTGNVDDLDFGGASIVRVDNASDTTIRGLVAGYPGQVVTFVCVGAGNVFFAYDDANSDAANRLLNWVTSGVTPCAAGVGTVSYEYDATESRWRLFAHEQGAGITPAFSAGDYTASGTMTYTVEGADVVAFTYFVRGRNLTLTYAIEGATVGGSASTVLRIAIPNGYDIATGTTQDYSWTFDNTTAKTGCILAVAGEAYIRNYRDITLAANWELITNNSFIRGNITFGIS